MTTRRTVMQALLAASLMPRAWSRTPDSRVVVVGAGFGGATCARYLRLLSPRTHVVLIDQRADFLTGPFSNLVIAGLRSEKSIRRQTTAIGRAVGVEAHVDAVTGLDPVARSVTTASGRTYRGDRIVVSPGVAMRWDSIQGLDAESSADMPHAWLGDSGVTRLRARLDQVRDGGTVLIGSPANPYRCPPGPYERASLIAHRLSTTGRGATKILVADAKDDFTKSGLFKLEWDQLYPGMIEWIPRAKGGEVVRVDAAVGEVWLRDATQPLRVDLASIVPPQQAAELARVADLTDESGWCPVHPENFESTRHVGIHVIGDASVAAPMPKSAFAANSQAKLCAAAIAAAFAGGPAPDPRFLNTCYSLVSADEAISVSGYYAAAGGKLTTLSDGMSPLSGDESLRKREAQQAKDWYSSITADSFGS